MPCRPSTSTNSVRRPPEASASASAAATLVLPVPPLPVTTCSRAGHLFTSSPTRSSVATAHSSPRDVADQPTRLVDRRECQRLLGGLLVVGGQGQLHRHRGAVVGLPVHRRLVPLERRPLVLVGQILDLRHPGGELVRVAGVPADQVVGGLRVLLGVDGGE